MRDEKPDTASRLSVATSFTAISADPWNQNTSPSWVVTDSAELPMYASTAS